MSAELRRKLAHEVTQKATHTPGQGNRSGAAGVIEEHSGENARKAGRHSRGMRRRRFTRGHRAGLVGLVLVVAIVLLAIAATWCYPGDPMDMVGPPSLWPGADARFPLGTDNMGRNLASGLLHGARVSLLVGACSAGIAIGVGITIGAIAGYIGGRIDDLLMRVTELFQTMPSFLFTIVLVVVFGSTLPVITLAIGFTSWPQVARLVRAESLRIRETDYVRAALTMGMGHLRILRLHVIPNSISPVIVLSAVLIGQAILTEASLSFLGLGDPDVVSWGMLVATGRPLLRTDWYMTVVPGLAILVAVTGFMLLGNWLNDHLNPRDGGH